MHNIGIFCGGQSAEHEVSVISAKNIFKAIDRELFNPIIIGVSRTSCFYRIEDQTFEKIDHIDDSIFAGKEQIQFVRYPNRTEIKTLDNKSEKIDCIFNIIHGQTGEDGCIQGFCEIYNLPYVGCNVLSSGISMDKEMIKLICKHNDIPVKNFFSITEESIPIYQECVSKVGSPFFMKIANLGSSIGVYKIKSEAEYNEKIKKIWKFGHKVLIEEAVINPQEVEIAALEVDGKIQLSRNVCEIKVNKKYEFYDYESKYLDPNGADLIIPASISEENVKKIKSISLRVFKAFQCSGMARLDFFVSNDEVFFNELNTLPGFTKISMYPTLFQDSGMSYTDLISNLIKSGFQRKKINIEGMMRDE
jgi:D-alanine-D-alanine ligase